jgi:hypothetical protein
MAKSAFGATLSVGGTALTEVVSISVPSLTGEVIDVSTHTSANRWREFIRGMRDAGEFSVTVRYTAGSTMDDLLIGTITSDTATAFVLSVAAASGRENLTISGFGTSYQVNELEIDSDQTATLTVKPTGAITQAVAA